jgi:hypothetical protein
MAILNVDVGVTCWSYRRSLRQYPTASAMAVHTSFALTVDMSGWDRPKGQGSDLGASNPANPLK